MNEDHITQPVKIKETGVVGELRGVARLPGQPALFHVRFIDGAEAEVEQWFGEQMLELMEPE